MAKRRRSHGKKSGGRSKKRKQEGERGSGGRGTRDRARTQYERRQDIVMLGSLVIVILMIISGYFVYNNYFSDEEESAGDGIEDTSYNPNVPGNGGSSGNQERGVTLMVINEVSHNFASNSRHNADRGGNTEFLLLVTNTGTATDTYKMSHTGSTGGWVLTFRETESDSVTVKAGGAMVVIVEISVPNDGKGEFTVYSNSIYNSSITASVDLTVDVTDIGTRTAALGDEVQVYYVLVDRGTDNDYNPDKWAYNQRGEFPFTIGEGVIQGFSDMAVGMKEGETKVMRLPVDKAYGSDPDDGRPDGDLIYEMYMETIKN